MGIPACIRHMRRTIALAFLHRIFATACLFGCGSLAAQNIADPVKEGPDSLTKLMKLWPTLSKSGTVEQHEQRPAGEIFGRPSLKTVGALSSGKFSRLDVLLISNGIGLTGPAFEEEYAKITQELPVAYAERFGAPGESQPAPAGAAPDTKTLFWAAGEIGISLIMEPTKRVRLSLRPLNEKEKAAGLERQAQARAEKWKEHVTRKPNGDVIIENLPLVEVAKEGTENFLRMVQMLQKYYSWKVDVEAGFKRLAGATGDEPTDVIILRELTTEAGVKLRVLPGFDASETAAAIDSGNLVLVLRGYGDARMNVLREFAAKQRKEPDLELPAANDAAEQKKWQSYGDATYSMISLVHGYNTKRGEIIFSQPGWNVAYQQLRIRPEELKTGTEYTMILSVPQ